MPLPYHTPDNPYPTRPREWQNGHALIIETATGRDLSITCQCGTAIAFVPHGRSMTIGADILKAWEDHITYLPKKDTP